VWVILSPHPVAKEDGALRVFGQCRNMVNHREDPEKDFDVTDRVVN